MEKTRGLFTSIPRPWGKLLLNKYTMWYSMLSTLMYIHTNHAEMNTSKPRNKSIMSMKYIYIYILARSEVNKRAGTHILRTCTQRTTCTRSTDTQKVWAAWSSTWRDISMITYHLREQWSVRRFLNTEGLTGSLSSLGNKFQNGAGPE